MEISISAQILLPKRNRVSLRPGLGHIWSAAHAPHSTHPPALQGSQPGSLPAVLHCRPRGLAQGGPLARLSQLKTTRSAAKLWSWTGGRKHTSGSSGLTGDGNERPRRPAWGGQRPCRVRAASWRLAFVPHRPLQEPV